MRTISIPVIELEALGCECIEDCFDEAQRLLSEQSILLAKFKFNGVACEVCAGSDKEKFIIQYQQCLAAKATGL